MKTKIWNNLVSIFAMLYTLWSFSVGVLYLSIIATIMASVSETLVLVYALIPVGFFGFTFVVGILLITGEYVIDKLHIKQRILDEN